MCAVAGASASCADRRRTEFNVLLHLQLMGRNERLRMRAHDSLLCVSDVIGAVFSITSSLRTHRGVVAV